VALPSDPEGDQVKKIEVRIWIQRPVEDVYNYVTTLEEWPKWRSDVVEGRMLTEGPLRVGAQGRGVGVLLGRRITIDVEITALEPAAAFGYRPIAGPLRTNNLYTFKSQDGGTLIVLTDEIRMKGFARILEPLMPGLVRSGYRKNLEGLKSVLEARTA
jgi:uncharacterized membrane protein